MENSKEKFKIQNSIHQGKRGCQKLKLSDLPQPISGYVRPVDDYPPPIEIVRMSDLVQITRMSKAMIYLIMNPLSKYYCPEFPERVYLTNGGGIVGWYRHEVEAWLLARPRKAA